MTSSLWRLGGHNWWQVTRRVWRRVFEDQLPGRCAELAYYFLFAVFPLLLFLTTLLGYLAGANPRLRNVLFVYVARVSPSNDVTALLRNTLDQITDGRGGAKLSLALVAAVWVASNGMLAVSRTLNAACGLTETRPWWKRRLLAMVLIVGFAVLCAISLTVMIYGRRIGVALADDVGVGPFFIAAYHALRWPLALVFVLASFDAVYNYAPCRTTDERKPWGTPGAAVGVGLWLAASYGFRLYLGEVNNYAYSYGSLGAVIVLLLWFYLTAFAIVVGGLLNAEIARLVVARRKTRRAAPKRA
jgi:membrane protein